MASIKKRSNGTYQATIYVGRDAKGKQLFKYITRDTKKECKAIAREIEQEIQEGRYINVENIRLIVWMEKWLELNKESISPSTYSSYVMYVEKHFKPYFKNLKLNQINDIHIKQYINDKLKNLSSTTVRKHFLVLRRILQDVLKHKNPAKDIKAPSKDDYKPYVITDEEFKQIHDFFKGHKYEIIVLLAAWCGLRRGEIFALKWDDIDWKNAIIRIDEACCITEEGVYVDKKPKSKNGLRSIIIPEYLLKLLERYRKCQKRITPRIFPMRPDQCSSFFAQKVKENNLPPIRFHDLRHYHASWLYKQGIPDQYAAQRLGHDINVLKGIYQHLDIESKTELDEKVKSLYNKGSG